MSGILWFNLNMGHLFHGLGCRIFSTIERFEFLYTERFDAVSDNMMFCSHVMMVSINA